MLHHIERILTPLSTLLRKELRLLAARADNSAAVPGSDYSIVCGQPFSETERALICEIADLARRGDENARLVRDLEDRLIAAQQENADLQVKNRVLSEISARDSLTGLYNRWYVIEKIETEINRSLRHGAPMALMMLDIDHFKRINDTWGHAAGDQVLQNVGRLLRDSCRVYDVPGRYGGEEFCVVLPQTEVENTPVVAERIRQRMESNEVRVGGESVIVTASIGVAGIGARDGELNTAALIERADQALYAAKRRGRNRVELWDSAAAPELSH